MVGSEAVQAAICQSVLYSRSLLRCASLREVRALLLLSIDNPEIRQGCTPACILGKDQLTRSPDCLGTSMHLPRVIAEAQDIVVMAKQASAARTCRP